MLDRIAQDERENLLDTQSNLIDLFNKYFEVVPADTPEKLRESYRLRYEVYYKEGLFPGMNVDDCPEELEYDQYDEQSAHCLLMHKPSGVIAGTVRVIPTDRQNPDARLPLEIIAGDLFFPDAIPHENISRAHLGEISRFILAPRFRARRGENRQPYGIPEDPDNSFQKNEWCQSSVSWQSLDCRGNAQRRSFLHAILGLFVAIVRMSVEQNLTFWYCNMNPVCARLLRSFGIDFKPITPVIDYHGPRQGHFGYIPDIMENIYRTKSQIWTLLTNNGALFPHQK